MEAEMATTAAMMTITVTETGDSSTRASIKGKKEEEERQWKPQKEILEVLNDI